MQLYLEAGCHPFSGNSPVPLNITHTGPILTAILRGCSVINDTSVPIYVDIVEPERKVSPEPDAGAVLYIVAVLVFYSAGITTMIVKYLKREKRELEEERALEDFFRSMPAYKKEREQNNVNRVAIQAFHALTSVSYDDGDDDITTSEEDEPRCCVETIHEVDDHVDLNSDAPVSDDSDNRDVDSLLTNVFEEQYGHLQIVEGSHVNSDGHSSNC